MITVETLEAKDRFAELLDRVEKGERVQITRDGKVVATLVGEERRRRADALKAVENLRALREEIREDLERRGEPPITTEEILGWIHEGRR